MRTDSVNLSNDAKNDIKEEITELYGKEYSKPRNFSNKAKGAQEAHEAIRPTNMKVQMVKDYDQDRLYKLIWKRAVASQMAEAQLERTNLKIENNKNNKLFTASGEVIKFEGFLKVYLEGTDNEEEEQAGILPKVSVGETVENKKITATERFTKPPYRYTEASLVKQLEELGIGRPSTYAPTISTIQRREYVAKSNIEGNERNYNQLILKEEKITEKILKENVGADKGKLIPTDIGNIVNDFLVENFKTILDFGFTAQVENEFDAIADGEQEWTSLLKNFYKDFHTNVQEVTEKAERAKGERLLGKDPETGKNVYAKLGRYGAMVQIGDVEDEEKPKFASLQVGQQLNTITYEEAMDLFKLPKTIGKHEEKEVIVSSGRFGPYVKYEKLYVSIPKEESPMSISLERAIELIKEKQKANEPIGTYENLPIQKGVGRFGPFIKWNNMFINVSKKYDFDNLSSSDLAELIEDKKKKEIEKIIHHWKEEGIKVEKARWGRSKITKGKIKIELPKTIDAKELTLDEVKEMIEKRTKSKK